MLRFATVVFFNKKLCAQKHIFDTRPKRLCISYVDKDLNECYILRVLPFGYNRVSF